MSAASVVVAVDSRSAREMLGQYGAREMANRLRRGTRAGGAVYRTPMRAAIRGGGYPRTFLRDPKGKRQMTHTSASMRTLSSTGIYTRVRPPSPLVAIFEHGARSHEIAPGKLRATGRGQLLSGRAGQRWRGRDFVASMPVQHPGMAARPLLGPIFGQFTGAAKRAAATTIFGDRAVGLLGLGGE